MQRVTASSPRARTAWTWLRARRLPALSLRAIRFLAIATTMSFVLATAIGTTGSVATRGTVAFGGSTTLTVIGGEVLVRSADGSEFRAAADGEILEVGMTVRTGPVSYAVLTYFEGSTVSLEPETTLLIQALEAQPDGSTGIAMHQELGRTWHSVQRLLGPGSKYEVTTPTATASVRGTLFAVGVQTDEQGELFTIVETTEGAVAAAKAPTPDEPQPTEEVIVQPGFEATVKLAAPLAPPKPAPQADREITVELGEASGVVLDTVGRANGLIDKKLVVQTPGAVVKVVDGKLVVTLPRIPEGRVAAVVEEKGVRRSVDFVTRVRERGKAERVTRDRIEAGGEGRAVGVVEVKGEGPAEPVPLSQEEKDDVASRVKVADPGGEEGREDEEDEDGGDGEGERRGDRDGPGGPRPPAGFLPDGTVPPLPIAGGGHARGASPKREGEEGDRAENGGGEDPDEEDRDGDEEAERDQEDADRVGEDEGPASKADEKKTPKPRGEGRSPESGFLPRGTLPPLPGSTPPGRRGAEDRDGEDRDRDREDKDDRSRQKGGEHDEPAPGAAS